MGQRDAPVEAIGATKNLLEGEEEERPGGLRRFKKSLPQSLLLKFQLYIYTYYQLTYFSLPNKYVNKVGNYEMGIGKWKSLFGRGMGQIGNSGDCTKGDLIGCGRV